MFWQADADENHTSDSFTPLLWIMVLSANEQPSPHTRLSWLAAAVAQVGSPITPANVSNEAERSRPHWCTARVESIWFLWESSGCHQPLVWFDFMSTNELAGKWWFTKNTLGSIPQYFASFRFRMCQIKHRSQIVMICDKWTLKTQVEPCFKVVVEMPASPCSLIVHLCVRINNYVNDMDWSEHVGFSHNIFLIFMVILTRESLVNFVQYVVENLLILFSELRWCRYQTQLSCYNPSQSC